MPPRRKTATSNRTGRALSPAASVVTTASELPPAAVPPAADANRRRTRAQNLKEGMSLVFSGHVRLHL